MATDNPPSSPAKPVKIQRFKISINILIQFVALVLILLMLNYLSFNHYKRWDFTRSHRYALSEKTIRVLAGLNPKKPVKVIIFFSAASDIGTDVVNLLKEYQYASSGKITVEIVDPVRNPTRAGEVESIYKLGKDENLVILDCGGKDDPATSHHKKFINALDMADLDRSGEAYGQPPTIRAFKGEQAITGGLLEVTDDKPNNLYVITGQGERDFNAQDYLATKTYIERENVSVQPLNLKNVDVVPQDARILFIVGPRYDFSDREIQMLRDFWEKKGRLFILLDPNAQKQTPNLMNFLAEQGIIVDNDRILRVTQTQLAAVAGLMRDVTGSFPEGSPITKNLKDAMGVYVGGTQSLVFDRAAAQKTGIRLTMLAQASQGYWGEVDYDLRDGDAVPYFDPKKDRGQPLVVVASAEKGAPNDPTLHVDSSRMIVAGNCEFISNKALSLSNANLDFTINSVDWLLDRVELMGISPKANTVFALNLTDTHLSRILFFYMGVIPGVVAVFGFGLWWKRRH